MKWLKVYLVNIVVSMLLLVAGVLGSPAVYAGGYSGAADVEDIQVINGGFYVRLDPSVAQNPDGCTSFNGWFIFLGPSLDANQKNIQDYLAVALTAFTLGKKLNVYARGCYNNYPKGFTTRMSK
jgi:hypothetical protein